MKLLFLISSLLLLFSFIYGQDTIYVTSRFDSRLKSFQDSISAYDIGKSVSENLSNLFHKFSNSDYTSYFMNAWKFSYKENDSPDTTILCFFNFSNIYPDPNEGKQFEGSLIGTEISNEYHRLDTLRVKPYAAVSGGELPTVYIYKKPSTVIIWKKIDRCWEKKAIFSVIDPQTYFITNDKKMTICPYNRKRVYINGKLSKEDWLDTIDHHVIKSFSY